MIKASDNLHETHSAQWTAKSTEPICPTIDEIRLWVDWRRASVVGTAAYGVE
jgi:hypothetical protein